MAGPPLSAARWRWRRGYLIAVTTLHADLVALAISMMVWQERLMAITAVAAVAGIGVATALGRAAKLEEGDASSLGWGAIALFVLFFAFFMTTGWRETIC